jgi:hypothetical protein
MSLDEVVWEHYDDLGDFAAGKYQLQELPPGNADARVALKRTGHLRVGDYVVELAVEKEITVYDQVEGVEIKYTLLSDTPNAEKTCENILFMPEFPFLVSGDPNQAYVRFHEVQASLDTQAFLEDPDIAFVDPQWGLAVEYSIQVSRGFNGAYFYPINCYARSNENYKVMYQGNVWAPRFWLSQILGKVLTLRIKCIKKGN